MKLVLVQVEWIVSRTKYGTLFTYLPRVPVAGDVISVVPFSGGYEGDDPPSELGEVREVTLHGSGDAEKPGPNHRNHRGLYASCIVEWRR